MTVVTVSDLYELCADRDKLIACLQGNKLITTKICEKCEEYMVFAPRRFSSIVSGTHGRGSSASGMLQPNATRSLVEANNFLLYRC